MADLLDQILGDTATMDPNTPSVFGANPVSAPAARRIVNTRLAQANYLADSREKLNQFRDRERARSQGQAALPKISQLDPTAADYPMQLRQVLMEHPEATLDATVNNFLGINDNIFGRAEKERQQIADERRTDLRQIERDRQETELAGTRARSELEIRRDAALQQEIDQLPSALLERFNGYRESGMDQRGAMARVKEDAISAGALTELADLGISPDSDEVVGLPDGKGGFIKEGIYDSQGRVDPKRFASLKASRLAGIAQEKQAKTVREDAARQFDRLSRYLRTLSENPMSDPEEKKRVQDAINHYARIAELDTGALPKQEGPGKVTGGAPPDTSRTDQFLPK